MLSRFISLIFLSFFDPLVPLLRLLPLVNFLRCKPPL